MGAKSIGGGGGRGSVTSLHAGPLVHEAARKVESEDEKIVRYERVIEKLRKMMEHERKLLKTSRGQY